MKIFNAFVNRLDDETINWIFPAVWRTTFPQLHTPNVAEIESIFLSFFDRVISKGLWAHRARTDPMGDI